MTSTDYPTIELIFPDNSLGMHVTQDETEFYFTLYQRDSSGAWTKQGEMILSKDLRQFSTGIDDFQRTEPDTGKWVIQDGIHK
jgi:hypothetical protein